MVAANRLHGRRAYRRGHRYTLALCLLILAGVAISMAFLPCYRLPEVVWVLAFASLLYILLTPLSIWTLTGAARRAYRQSTLLRSEQQVRCDEETISFTSRHGAAQFRWSDFYRWTMDDRMLLLYQNGLAFYSIPLRAFPPGAGSQISAWIEAAGVKRR